MSKVLIFSDLHIAQHKKDASRLADCLKALEWVFNTANKHNIKKIIFVGDLFHDRQNIDVFTYQNAFQVFQKHLQYNSDPPHVYLLLGNHDMWHEEKWNISSVYPLSALDSITIINQPCTKKILGHDISFLPYTKNPIEDIKGIKNRFVLFAHVAIDGALWNVRYNTVADVTIEHDGDMVKVGPEMFKDWQHVFMGHYHAAQQLTDNAEYIGSPLQLDFGEVDQDKHILIFDLDTQEKQYIKNDFSPKHFYYVPKKDGDIEKWQLKNSLRPGDFIDVFTENLKSPDALDYQKILQDVTGQPVRIRKKSVVKEAKSAIDEARSILFNESEMAKQYIQSVGTKLDESRLIDIFNLIRKEKAENGKK